MEIKSGLSRSPRNTGMAGATGSTSSHVGPGSYNHTGGVSSTGGAAKSYAGFMTSAVRPSTTGGSGGSGGAINQSPRQWYSGGWVEPRRHSNEIIRGHSWGHSGGHCGICAVGEF